MRILILTPYYNRPILVKNFLRSLREADKHHKDWELGILDDGSEIPVKPIVEEEMSGHMHKITMDHSGMTFDDKIEHGICLGKHANEHMKKSEADIAIMIHDDDELYPTYLKDLSEYFTDNPNVLYCHSRIYLYNPLHQSSNEVSNLSNKYNQFKFPINPVANVDATQVAWRLSCCKEHGAWFEESTRLIPNMPWVKDTDRSFFENLYDQCGESQYSGLIAAYKGTHEYQLLWHKKTDEDGLRKYDNMVKDLAGKVL